MPQSERQPSPSSSNSDDFRLLNEAPESIPTLTVGGQTIAASQYEWRVSGTWLRKQVTNPADLHVPSVETVDRKLLLELSPATRPFQLIVGLYFDVDTDGLPDESTASQVDCLKSAVCSLTSSATAITVAVKVDDAQFVVVRVAYLSPTLDLTDGSSVDAPARFTAAWVVRTNG